MADDNLSAPAEPVANTDVPKSFDQQVEDITGLLDAPETDRAEEKPAAEAATAAEPEDDPLGLNADAEDDGKVDADTPDGPQDAEIKGGRFAPDTAKVTLDDGSVITVAELKRNNLYHAGFTQKTQELAKERETFAVERKKVADDAQSLSAFRDYAAWYAGQFIPQKPEPFKGDPNLDPVGYQNYLYQKEQWQTHAEAYQAFQQNKTAEDQRRQGETAGQARARAADEAAKLVEAIPMLKDPAKAKAFGETLRAGAMEHYGITPEEVNSIGDRRMVLALRDALAYRRMKAKAPTVQAEVRRPVVRPAQRQAPNATATREKQALTERFHKSGNFDDGVALITTLIR